MKSISAEYPKKISRKFGSCEKLSLKQLDIIQSLLKSASKGNEDLEDGEFFVNQRPISTETPPTVSIDLANELDRPAYLGTELGLITEPPVTRDGSANLGHLILPMGQTSVHPANFGIASDPSSVDHNKSLLGDIAIDTISLASLSSKENSRPPSNTGDFSHRESAFAGKLSLREAKKMARCKILKNFARLRHCQEEEEECVFG